PADGGTRPRVPAGRLVPPSCACPRRKRQADLGQGLPGPDTGGGPPPVPAAPSNGFAFRAPPEIGANFGNWLPAMLNPPLPRLFPQGWDAGQWVRGHEPQQLLLGRLDHCWERFGAAERLGLPVVTCTVPVDDFRVSYSHGTLRRSAEVRLHMP